jgi:hypothetical protein
MSILNAASPILKVPITLINPYTVNGVTPASTGQFLTMGAKEILAGALTANVYKEILAVTGSGILQLAGVMSKDASSRTLGIKVVLDGATIVDVVSAAVADSTRSVIPIGLGGGSGTVSQWDRLPFFTSLSISIKSSLSETDLISAGYRYYLV